MDDEAIRTGWGFQRTGDETVWTGLCFQQIGKKAVQLLDKQLVNEKPLVYAFARDMTKLILQLLFLVINALFQLLMN